MEKESQQKLKGLDRADQLQKEYKGLSDDELRTINSLYTGKMQTVEQFRNTVLIVLPAVTLCAVLIGLLSPFPSKSAVLLFMAIVASPSLFFLIVCSYHLIYIKGWVLKREISMYALKQREMEE